MERSRYPFREYGEKEKDKHTDNQLFFHWSLMTDLIQEMMLLVTTWIDSINQFHTM